jgi:hypothetical protein
MLQGWSKSQPPMFWALLAFDLILFCFVAFLYTKTVFASEKPMTFIVKDRANIPGMDGYLVSPVIAPLLVITPEGGAAGTAKGEILMDCTSANEVTSVGKDERGQRVNVFETVLTCGKAKAKYRLRGIVLQP